MSKYNEPIALVGIGCRFPGASSSPQKFWENLLSKTDAITEVPHDRWDNRRFYHDTDNKPGKIRTNQGGFLKEDITAFDPLFFGISPIEAECLDPQERLLLEVTYEAFEDAGLKLEDLKGSDTGVFVGGFTFDNFLLQVAQNNQHIIDSNTATGVSLAMLSNKISYTFDLRGPSITIDTACSSSLVALHYACQSLWNGETKVGVVGGANVITLPANSVLMSKGMFLSTDGRCKSFDASGNGYGRGEGAGIVILKPLRDAVRDGDRIYSLIVGTGVNQDGKTNGVTVPNKDSQKALIEKIYAENDFDFNKLHYVEAHGTGTAVGDPIEFSAINEVLKEQNKKEKCLIGSVKSNIGHLEAAAGVAGLIKTALSLYNNTVPPNLHFNNPNPALNYEESILKVPCEIEELPSDKTSYASINSFGYGGTNAHIVLKQYEPTIENNTNQSNPIKQDQFIFPISARSKPALKQLASSYREMISQEEVEIGKILSNTVYRRSHLSNRLAIVASSSAELVDKLEAYEEDIVLPGIVENAINPKQNKVVFVYTGMGPQWWKMGQELMKTEPVFYNAIKDCDECFREIAGWSILEEMSLPEEQSRIKETRIAQPANFVIQVALTKLMAHYGVSPDAVVGHSVGEVASAYVSGALTLKEAITISFHRSRLQQTVAGKGKMIAVGLGEDQSSKIINGYKGVSVAAVNSPNSITLAGDETEIHYIASHCQESGVFNRVLEVEVPYHSPLMSLIKEDLLDAVEEIKGTQTTIDLYSTVTGDMITGDKVDNNYWWRNVREPVRFSKTVDALVRDSYNVFVEIGPHPVLKNSILECTNNQNKIQLVQTLNRKKGEAENFFENLALFHTIGVDLNWGRWIDSVPHFELPAYPWQKESLWRESKHSLEYRKGREGNIFFNRLVDAPQTTYQVELNKFYFPFINDHMVQGKVVFPGAGYIAAGLAISQFELRNELPFSMEHLEFHQMLTIDDTKVQNLFTSYDAKNYFYSVYSKEEAENAYWVKRATGKVIYGAQKSSERKVDIDELMDRMTKGLTEEEVYQLLSDVKLVYGPHFRTIKSMRIGDNEVITRIKLHPDLKEHNSDNDYYIHPTLLDGCFQSVIGFDSSEFVPVSIGRMNCIQPIGEEFYCHAVMKKVVSRAVISDLYIYNLDGTIALEIKDFRCQEIASKNIHDTNFLEERLVYPTWIKEDQPTEEGANKEELVSYLFTSDYEAAKPFVSEAQNEYVILEKSDRFEKVNDNHYKFDFNNFDSIYSIINLEKRNVWISLFGLENNDKIISSEQCVQHISPLLQMVRSVHSHGKHQVCINVLTENSQQVLEQEALSAFDLSVLHGMGRLIVNEIPNCSVKLFDLETGDKTQKATEVLDMIVHRCQNETVRFEELACRGGEVYKKKIIRWEVDDVSVSSQEIKFQENALKLTVDKDAVIEGLKFQYCDRVAPKADEIEILVNQASINYKDYLKITGKINPKVLEGTFFKETLGIDCTGVVTRVGKDVSRFKVGDEVMAMAPGTFQTYTNTPETLAIKKPKALNGAEASSILAYATAYYCLNYKASLKKGDKVLIHNATGGVGLAAVHYAQSVGAEIFATVGTAAKRTYLESIGIKNIFSSRDVSFAREILEITKDKGVDVVLSAQPDEILHQNFYVLAPFGVYVEIGKRGMIENSFLQMRFFNDNLSFIAVDIDKVCEERKDIMCKLLDELYFYFEKEQFKSVPYVTYTPDQLVEAFQLIEQSKHIGKVVLDFENQMVTVEKEEAFLQKDKTYLITGGTRGLGLEIANWLTAHGAQHLALMSRSGLKEEYAQKTVQRLRDSGITVEVLKTDISDQEQMRSAFDRINEDMPEVAGVFHCAMVLDDALLLELDEERFEKVLKPKVDGALNLLAGVKNMNPDFFVSFSSISSLIGNIGQANYIAANAFLDNFAFYSRKLGVNATTINLGVMKEAGVVSRNKKLGKILESFGTLGLTNQQFFEGLEYILKAKPTQIGFFNLDWETFSNNAGDSTRFLFEDILKVEKQSKKGFSEEQLSVLEDLSEMESSDQHVYVSEQLIKEVSSTLKIKQDKVDPDVGVNFLGVDSILAIELIKRIKNKFIVEIIPIEFLSGPSVNELSGTILERLHKSYLD